jgi:kumamolisin
MSYGSAGCSATIILAGLVLPPISSIPAPRIAELAAAGVPLFVSSGDARAWNNEFQPDVSYPASDTNAIAVGGTTVLETTVRNRLSETGWSDSGGGVSSIFSPPTYQFGLSGAASHVYKNVPDLAMLADPYAGAATFAPDAFGSAGEVPVDQPCAAGAFPWTFSVGLTPSVYQCPWKEDWK